MNNLHEYNEFKNKKNINNVQESAAQLFEDIWKCRTRIDIPSSLINAFMKKVQQETGEKISDKWSPQEIAEEIVNFLPSFLTIENLPSSIISASQQAPKIQTQGEMETQTQVQPTEEPVAQAPAQDVPTEAAPVEPVAPATPVQQTPAQAAATTVPQTEQSI
jgi:hypothetical protein